MKTLLDVHTHTVASGHAYSTIQEMVTRAQELGLEILGITEHGPNIPGTCSPIYFRNMHVVPRHWGSLRLLMGVELNILGYNGELDLDENYYRRMDIIIAGIHSLCYRPGTRTQNTDGMVAAIENPWTHIISHPGDGTADLDFEPVVMAAKRSNTLLEINSSSLIPSRHKVMAKPNNLEILSLCKKHDVPVILGSDAHISFSIADYRYALPLLQEAEFPEELVVNDKPSLFVDYLGLDLK